MKKFDLVYYDCSPHVVTAINKNNVSIAGIKKYGKGAYVYEINVKYNDLQPYIYSGITDITILRLREYIKLHTNIFGFIDQEPLLKAFA